MTNSPPLSEAQFQERVVRIERPTRHYTLLRAPNGQYLGTIDGKQLQTFRQVDDTPIWEHCVEANLYRHVVTGLEISDGSVDFVPEHGPAQMPSNYLKFFRENGWVGLECILSPDAVAALQRVSGTGDWENQPSDPNRMPFNVDSVVAKTAVEPVSLWLMRQYLRTDHIRLGHAPSFAVLEKDDGKRDVLAWHSDFPYLWGITSRVGGDRIPAHDSGEFCMAIQRNVCITDFTKQNGATAFKLGSHRENCGPPKEWGTGSEYSQPGHRAKYGLPYTGPEADVVEAPAGSVILYDARTWHRTGFNRTDHKRGAMLQAVIPMYIMPFMDTSRPYKEFLASDLVQELNDREQEELRDLMIHRIIGPRGKFAIGVDDELTALVRKNGTQPLE